MYEYKNCKFLIFLVNLTKLFIVYYNITMSRIQAHTVQDYLLIICYPIIIYPETNLWVPREAGGTFVATTLFYTDFN